MFGTHFAKVISTTLRPSTLYVHAPNVLLNHHTHTHPIQGRCLLSQLPSKKKPSLHADTKAWYHHPPPSLHNSQPIFSSRETPPSATATIKITTNSLQQSSSLLAPLLLQQQPHRPTNATTTTNPRHTLSIRRYLLVSSLLQPQNQTPTLPWSSTFDLCMLLGTAWSVFSRGGNRVVWANQRKSLYRQKSWRAISPIHHHHNNKSKHRQRALFLTLVILSMKEISQLYWYHVAASTHRLYCI